MQFALLEHLPSQAHSQVNCPTKLLTKVGSVASCGPAVGGTVSMVCFG